MKTPVQSRQTPSPNPKTVNVPAIIATTVAITLAAVLAFVMVGNTIHGHDSTGQAALAQDMPPDGGGGAGPRYPTNTSTAGGAESAIAWAETFEQSGANYGLARLYPALCLKFVANAYGSYYSGKDTALLMEESITLNDPGDPSRAPRGSLMWFGPNKENHEEGHVGIGLGGGQMLGANVPSANIPEVVMVYPTPNVQSSSYWRGIYKGWSWPPASWGPLARQAAQQEDQAPVTAPAANPGPKSGGLKVSTAPQSNPNLQGGVSPQNANNGSALQQGANPQNAGNGNQVQNAPTGKSKDTGGAGPSKQPGAKQSHKPATIPAPAPSQTPPAATPPKTWAEITGSEVHTWSNPYNAGGLAGPVLAPQTTIQVRCYIPNGHAWTNGNANWYLLTGTAPDGSSLDGFWASADAEYNGSPPGGPLKGTNYVDSSVAQC